MAVPAFLHLFLENRSPGQTVAKNTFWLFFGQLMSRLLRAVIVIAAARMLGAASWGAFSYALGIATFLTTFSDIGVNALITKEAARSPEAKYAYLATALIAKLGILAVLVPAVFIALPYLTNILEARLLLPILIFVFIFDTLRELGASFARALENMQVEAGALIATNIMITVFGIMFLASFGTSISLATGYALGSGLGLFAIIFALRTHLHHIFSHVNLRLIRPILTTAWPFGLMSLMGVIALNTDIVMLGWMRTPEEVGYYAAAQKLIYLLYVLPGLVAASLFPLTTRLAKNDTERAGTLISRAVAGLFLTSLLITLGGILLGNTIITTFFGAAYAPAILSFQILMLTPLIVYPSILIGNTLFAYDEKKRFALFVAISALSNTILNLLLIPPFGIAGAAAATVLSQILTNIFIWRAMERIQPLRFFEGCRWWIRHLRPHNRNSS